MTAEVPVWLLLVLAVLPPIVALGGVALTNWTNRRIADEARKAQRRDELDHRAGAVFGRVLSHLQALSDDGTTYTTLQLSWQDWNSEAYQLSKEVTQAVVALHPLPEIRSAGMQLSGELISLIGLVDLANGLQANLELPDEAIAALGWTERDALIAERDPILAELAVTKSEAKERCVASFSWLHHTNPIEE